MDASKIIDEKLATLTDWRGDVMRKVRALIREVDPDVVEEWKWMGTPVWNHDGILFSANAHKTAVKVTFLYGASLPDPKKLFNSELGGNARRAIDFKEGDKIDAPALKNLFRAAIARNVEKPAKRKAMPKTGVTAKKKPAAKKK